MRRLQDRLDTEVIAKLRKLSVVPDDKAVSGSSKTRINSAIDVPLLATNVSGGNLKPVQSKADLLGTSRMGSQEVVKQSVKSAGPSVKQQDKYSNLLDLAGELVCNRKVLRAICHENKIRIIKSGELEIVDSRQVNRLAVLVEQISPYVKVDLYAQIRNVIVSDLLRVCSSELVQVQQDQTGAKVISRSDLNDIDELVKTMIRRPPARKKSKKKAEDFVESSRNIVQESRWKQRQKQKIDELKKEVRDLRIKFRRASEHECLLLNRSKKQLENELSRVISQAEGEEARELKRLRQQVSKLRYFERKKVSGVPYIQGGAPTLSKNKR